MANARETRVLSRLVDLASLQNYVWDRFTDVGAPLYKGQAIVIPNIGALTIYPDGSVPRLAADRNNPAPNELTLTINQEPFIPVQMPAVSQIENLAGNWDNAIAEQVMIQLRNYVDQLLLDYLAGTVAWTNTNTDGGSHNNSAYQTNLLADTVTPADMLITRGLMLRQSATYARNLVWIIDPLMSAAVMGFSGWQNQVVNNQYGADMIGRVYGIDVIESQAVRTSKTFATLTGANHASNVLTLTFSSNPGLVPGEPITTAGLSASWANVSSVVVATVSSDGLTVTIPVTHADGGNVWQAGATVRENSAVNLLVDRSHIYTAMQKVPSTRWIEDPDTTGDILQASALFGFLGRAGRVRAFRSPDTGF